MSQPAPLDQLAERVEHLLLRHEELLRTQDLLQGQVKQLTQERDLLKSRLSAARARVDALIERLPASTHAPLAPVSADAVAAPQHGGNA